jgi:2-polyprenyl-3-methyl-5-hydroxy-6-metoxy-1,4-benzoquinol methylase
MAEVSLLQCNCGLVITSPRPSVEEIGEHYPPSYYSYTPRPLTFTRRVANKLREYKGGYPVEERFPARLFWKATTALLGNMFLYYLPYQGSGKSLLEVGCGTGADLLWAKERGWDVHGLEISEGAVEVARMRGLENVRCATFENADLAPDSFDCIAMTQVLEHLYSPSLALRRCHQLLRQNGLLLIAVPKFDSWTRHALGNFWHNLLFPIHLYHFNRPVLERMIEDAGFRVCEVRLSSRLLNLYHALITMRRFHILGRVFTRPQGTLSDVMLVVAEKV